MSAVNLSELHRVETTSGSYVEPALDQDWSDLDKLRWKARVVEVDAELPIGWFDVRQSGYGFLLFYPGMGSTEQDYSDVWRRLTYLHEGVQLHRRLATRALGRSAAKGSTRS